MALSFTNCLFFSPSAEPILAIPAAGTVATRLSPLRCADNPEFIRAPGDLTPEAASVLAVAVLSKAFTIEENRSALITGHREARSSNHCSQKSAGAGALLPSQSLTVPSLAFRNPRRQPLEPSLR